MINIHYDIYANIAVKLYWVLLLLTCQTLFCIISLQSGGFIIQLI